MQTLRDDGCTVMDLTGNELAKADEFCYTDPVDGSVSAHQGIRFIFKDGSRIVFRLSGTGVGGATVRIYLEKYVSDPDRLHAEPAEALEDLLNTGTGLLLVLLRDLDRVRLRGLVLDDQLLRARRGAGRHAPC